MMDVEGDGILRLAAAAVLFPNGWSAAEKLGHTTADIHGPVPLYSQHISNAVDQFLARVKPGKPFIRSNWSVTDSPRLFRPMTEVGRAALRCGMERRSAQHN